MGSSKISFEASLATDVVESCRCVGCGACVAVCPYDCLTLIQGRPSLVKECKSCGICAQACPSYNFSQVQMEKFVFGRNRKPEEPFGLYRRLVVAQAADEEILNASQDGGVATALLSYALKSGHVDGAVVTGASKEKPFYPIPKLASAFTEILESAGTKYTCSPNIPLLIEACKQKKKKVAFVGTPCQVQAIRKMQAAGLTKHTGCLNFTIGLMCSGCFTYEGLMENYIHGELGVDLSEIKKLNIKGKLLLTTASGGHRNSSCRNKKVPAEKLRRLRRFQRRTRRYFRWRLRLRRVDPRNHSYQKRRRVVFRCGASWIFAHQDRGCRS